MDAYSILIIALIILLLLAARELSCWYFKINDHLAKQDETNKLLKKLIMLESGEPAEKDSKTVPKKPAEKGIKGIGQKAWNNITEGL